MYKFLIFDADHTLFDFDRAEKDAIEKVMIDFGIANKPSLLLEYKKINHQLPCAFTSQPHLLHAPLNAHPLQAKLSKLG